MAPEPMVDLEEGRGMEVEIEAKDPETDEELVNIEIDEEGGATITVGEPEKEKIETKHRQNLAEFWTSRN